MKQIQMEATIRKVLGKGPVGRMRKTNLVPAVLYGRGEKTINLEVKQKDIHQAIHTSAGTNVLVKLNIVGGESPREETVMIKALQRHPVHSQLMHVDLIKVSLDQPLETTVPVVILGTAPGIKEGGILEVVHRNLAIRCLPALIPENITVDVSQLGIGDAIMVSDLPAMEGIEIRVEVHEPIVHVGSPKMEETPAPEAGAIPVAPEVQQPEVIGEKEREARRTEKEKEKEKQQKGE